MSPTNPGWYNYQHSMSGITIQLIDTNLPDTLVALYRWGVLTGDLKSYTVAYNKGGVEVTLNKRNGGVHTARYGDWVYSESNPNWREGEPSTLIRVTSDQDIQDQHWKLTRPDPPRDKAKRKRD